MIMHIGVKEISTIMTVKLNYGTSAIKAYNGSSNILKSRTKGIYFFRDQPRRSKATFY